tara:strand:+ start:186 stop:479 length:294 start_codon:yes stop_codon:yes gene_type:complete
MAFFENIRIDPANAVELSAVTYTQIVIDTGGSVDINGVTVTNTGAPYTLEMRVRSLENPVGNVYAVGTPIESDNTPVVVVTSYFEDSYIDDDYFETT